MMLAWLMSALLAGALEPRIAAADDAEVVQRGMLLAGEGKVLAAMELVAGAEVEEGLKRDLLGTWHSCVGEWERVEALRGRKQRENVVVAEEAAGEGEGEGEARLTPALDAIAAAARGRRIVIINEAHDSPQHRVFILALAQRLREEGFDRLAMEALNEPAEATRRRGYPLRSTGYYTSEPMFGDLIRQSVKLGYTLVHYEALFLDPAVMKDPVAGINAREQAQCDNLVRRVFDLDPQARVLIHVGYDHVMEQPVQAKAGEIRWLACRLKDATGLDPLTIDQITALKLPAESNVKHDQPSLLSTGDGGFAVGGHFAGQVDLQVFHPPVEEVHGRPDWLSRSGERVPIAIPADLKLSEAGPTLIQAFLTEEEGDTVPADQFVARDAAAPPPLMLAPGRYRVVSQDGEGKELGRVEVRE